jgi:hypothetical protein
LVVVPASAETLRRSDCTSALRLTEALVELTRPTSGLLLTEALEGISLLSQEHETRGTTFMHATKARTRASSGRLTGAPLAEIRFRQDPIVRLASSSVRRLEMRGVLPLSSGP